MISDHSDEIANRVLRQICRDSKLHEIAKLPENELLERTKQMLQHIDRWLVSKEDDLRHKYERLGRQRYEDGIPLHEVVRALQLVRENMIQYVLDQGYAQTPLDLYAEEELQHGADRIFDSIIFYFVRGYELAMREQVATAAGSSKARGGNELNWP
jgi:hypothetical protein